MPIYEYQCAECGETLEEIQAVDDRPLTECPACKSSSLRKLLSAPAFQFKGTGWYVTDYTDRGKKAPTKESGGSETKADAAESKTDSKKESSSKASSAVGSSES